MDYLEVLSSDSRTADAEGRFRARDMSLSLGQSESYINKIENRRTLPSMTGFFYICEYLNITPQEFFNFDAAAPRKAKELLHEIEKLTPEQSEHVLQIVRDISHK